MYRIICTYQVIDICIAYTMVNSIYTFPTIRSRLKIIQRTGQKVGIISFIRGTIVLNRIHFNCLILILGLVVCVSVKKLLENRRFRQVFDFDFFFRGSQSFFFAADVEGEPLLDLATV